jgi:flagellar basal-body rod protein FlgF
MAGAKQLMQAQALNSHNLANVSTTGFRAELAAFRSTPIVGAGYPTRVFPQADLGGTDLNQGSKEVTGRELDISLEGKGWIAVVAEDGTEAYTRAGDLRIGSGRILTTGTGNLVLGSKGPIAIPPAQKIDIAADGNITIIPEGEEPNNTTRVDRIKLVNPPEENLVKGLDGLMRTRNNVPAAADTQVTLISGSLENSNVNAVDGLVNMISLARQYEAQIKLMRAAEDNDAAMTRAMGLS